MSYRIEFQKPSGAVIRFKFDSRPRFIKTNSNLVVNINISLCMIWKYRKIRKKTLKIEGNPPRILEKSYESFLRINLFVVDVIK